MASKIDPTHAARQRRYRAHQRGDHSQCDPQRCDQAAVTPASPADVTDDGRPVMPRYLRARGRRLWKQLAEDANPGPAEVVLIEEACRLADRLDRMDAIVSGRDRAWLTLEIPDAGGPVEVVVDKMLAEARQQQVALKQLLSELRQAKGSAPAQTRQGGSRRDDLAQRRAERRKAAGL